MLAFLLITIALLIIVSVYYYLLKYPTKHKYLLPYHVTNITKQKKFYINKYIIKMETNAELKEIDIKNHRCYYFDNTTKIEDFDLDNILIYGKSYENIVVYNFSYKILIDAKPLRIKF